ncbi:hypothetical protein B0H13DRAFT_2366632 [Mycena leptocephala]|nr:hypothetical protein B0H13DRAFT_2366632 [Mycena leptocephala]
MASSYLHPSLPAATCLSILSLYSRSRSSSPRRSSPGCSGAERFYEARRSPALSAPAVRKNETVVAAYPPFCRTAPRRPSEGGRCRGCMTSGRTSTMRRVFTPPRPPHLLRELERGYPDLHRKKVVMKGKEV